MQSFLSRLNEYVHKEEKEDEENYTDNYKNEYKNKSRNDNSNSNSNRSNNNNNKKANLGKFRSIGGMRVVVGKYIGLDDQGKCILPWDWSIWFIVILKSVSVWYNVMLCDAMKCNQVWLSVIKCNMMWCYEV